MTKKNLRLAPGLSLPAEDVVTRTIGILGQRGAGKSNVGVVLAEEMHAAGVPWVAIDPKGDWWGLRSSGDGKADGGLPVPILGGLHGDVPLEASAGTVIADLVVDENLTAVLDVSDFSLADRHRFLVDFAEGLYRRHRRDPHPRHVFLEEAHEYIPQQGTRDRARVKEAVARIPLMGRSFGLGSTTMTQRSARLHKDVLTQVGTVIAMRTGSPQDRKAIEAWVEEHALGKDLVASLPGLGNGEAWIWSPHDFEIMERVQFRRRRTFDSGAAPTLKGKARKPATLADVDLGALTDRMAATIEKAKADDPAELRKQVAALKRELVKVEKAKPAIPDPVVERVEVPVLTDEDRTKLDALSDRSDALEKRVGELRGETSDVVQVTASLADSVTDLLAAVVLREGPTGPAPPSRPRHSAPKAPPKAPSRGRAQTTTPSAGSPGELTGPQQRVLDAVAWWGPVGYERPSKIQVGFIAGYRVGKRVGGTFGNILGQLRGMGLIDYPGAGSVELTGDGHAAAQIPGIEPTTAALQSAVFDRLNDPECRVLQVLIDARLEGELLTKQEVGARAGYTVGDRVGGTFGNILGRLRSLGLIDYPSAGTAMALDVLFLEDVR